MNNPPSLRIEERESEAPDAGPAKRKKERTRKHYADYAESGPDDVRLNAELDKYFIRLPVYELYDMSVAAPLVGKTLNALKVFLGRHRDKFPPRYRQYKAGRWTRTVRVLTSREILEMRTYTLKGAGRFTQ